MHSAALERLSRAFARGETRRSLTRLLGVPILGGLLAGLDSGPATAADDDHGSSHRRRRRSTRHKHDRNRVRRNKKHKPHGPKKPRRNDTSCPVCQALNNAGQCVADPGLNRTVCAGSGATTSVCCNGACWDGCCDGAGNPGACLTFVTSTTYPGTLGGLAGADAKCQARAVAGVRPGVYKAWLATGPGENESPAMGRFRQSGQPYRRVDGEVVAENWADLVDGSDLSQPILVTELGTSLESDSDFAWANTTPRGVPGTKGFLNSCSDYSDEDNDCQDWTSIDDDVGGIGVPVFAECNWTGGSSTSCNAEHRLYCFQQR